MTLRPVLFALLYLVSAFGQPAFDAQVKSHVDAGDFIGSVLVAKDGHVLYRKSFGLAQAEWDIANTPETKFRLGSITKQFTAVAALQLVEQGKIKLDDPVKKYYADAPPAWDAITIHHLLNHTSGIPSYTGLPNFFEKYAMLPMKPAEIVKLTQDRPLEFTPGSKFNYDNTGYVLLGAIIETVTGKPYGEHLRDVIFTPLGMKDTGYDVTATVLKNRASGYERKGKGLENARYLDMTLPHAAGALYSTVDDLLKWDQALYTEKLITAASRQKMLTPGLNGYGYGWNVRTWGSYTVTEHGGGINGFSTHLLRVPAEKLLVVTLANFSTPGASKLAQELAKLALGIPLPQALPTKGARLP
jgi:CubicO group peptidase (beta-lactamase class C family)